MRGPGDRASKRSIRKEPTLFLEAQGHDDTARDAEKAVKFPRGRKSSARTHTPHAREPGDLGSASLSLFDSTQLRKGKSHKPQSQASEESDEGVVPEKASKTRVTPVEKLEGRPKADGEIRSTTHALDPEPGTCAHIHERIGQRAQEKREEKLTNLLSHIKAPLLKEAYNGEAATPTSTRCRNLDRGRVDAYRRTGSGSSPYPAPALPQLCLSFVK